MKKKTTWIKILEIAMQVVPITIYVILNYKSFIKTPSQMIGMGAIVVLLTFLFIFKDSIRRFYKTPGAFKFALTVFILAGLGLWVGESLFALATVELISISLSIPVQIWYNYMTKPATSQDMMSALKEILNKKETDKSDEKSNENN